MKYKINIKLMYGCQNVRNGKNFAGREIFNLRNEVDVTTYL